MHPITYVFLATDRIADLHRDADRRRLASTASRPGRPTITHRLAASRPVLPCTSAG